MELIGLLSPPYPAMLRRMPDSIPTKAGVTAGEILPPQATEAGQPAPTPTLAPALTPAGQAALAAAADLARQATAANTLRAYKADWAHFAAWCDANGFVPVPADPKTVGAY